MLSSIWQWLKQLFQRLLGLIFPSLRKSRGNRRLHLESDSLPPLSDTDYEFLFSQLLEGVANGWQQKRILKFFDDLGSRGRQHEWVAWLKRFGDTVLASNAPNQQLAIRMVRLGQVTEFLPPVRRLGQEAYEIGQQLLNRGKKTQIWHYSETDNQQDSPTPDPITQEQDEALSPDELLALLHKDRKLALRIGAQLGIQTDDPEQVIHALMNQVIELNNKKSASNPNSEINWFQKGVEKANAGDLEGAIADWDKAIDLNPYLFQAWYNRGCALGNLGKLEEALFSFEEALKINPNDFMSWNDKGNTLYKLQRWEEALVCWDKVIEIKPEYHPAWYNRGCALEHLGKLIESLESYQEALAIKPDFTLAQSQLDKLRQRLEQG